jgi:hypothetical protein
MLRWKAPTVTWTRRDFAGLLLPQRLLFGQGIATRNVTPRPRGKPSGLPFHAQFTDIGPAAGLRAPVIYGEAGHKTYILETVGCGAAFLDYDNDGWMDILILSGTRLDSAPNSTGATNRLYRNNRDSTFSDVTEKAGLHRTGWASAVAVGDYNNDGLDDLFITCWGQNVLYRNNGDGTFTDVTREAGLLHDKTRWGSGCSFVDYDRNGLLDLFVANYLEFDPKKHTASRWRRLLQLEGHPGALRSARSAAWCALALSQQRQRHVYRRQRRFGRGERQRQLHDDGCGCRFR